MDDAALTSILGAGGLAIGGACVGSFCATLAIRLTRGEQALTGRSHCDHCQTPLGLMQTIPIVSYGAARGKCLSCSGRIDPLHLVGEIGGAVVGALALSARGPVESFLVGLVGFTLIISALVDWRTKKLPDVATLIVGLCGLGLSAMVGQGQLIVSLIAALTTGIILHLIRATSQLVGRPVGLGWGDVKLMAALALWLGTETPWMVAVASGLGLAGMFIIKPADGKLPFGPFIAASAFSIGVVMEAGLWPVLL